jgi:RNA polymerase sigma factor (TIGR02999 family)
MRQVLLDYAKRQRAAKRGGARRQVSLGEVDEMLLARTELGDPHSEALLALEEALARLEQHDQLHARVVECRFYGGMSIEETAVALGSSPATVKRKWAFARAYLNRELTQ